MFRPWIGARYGDGANRLGGIRLLVLGESHYCDDTSLIGTCAPDLTSAVVRRWAIEQPHRFFTGVTQVVGGQPKWQLGREGVQAIWDSLAFYNYVPVFAGAGPRERPTPEMFASAREPFVSIVEELKPKAILVCGFELWGWLLAGLPNGGPDRSWELPFHEIDGAIAARMKHPSAAFSTATWRPTVVSLLEQARERRDLSAPNDQAT